MGAFNTTVEWDRRAFLAHAAGAATTMALSDSPTHADGSQPIVDTHQHLWDLSRFRLPWVKGAGKLNRSFVMADYLAATKELGVVKAVYMEVDVDESQQLAEAEYVLDICRRGAAPTVGAVISGRPGSDGFADYIRRFNGNRYIKGVRQVLHVADAKPGTCLGERFIESVRLLGELGMSFDLCMRPAELGDAARLVEQCPDTRFIVDHCGNASLAAFEKSPKTPPGHDANQWRRDMAKLAGWPNTVCKISGIIAQLPPGAPAADLLTPIIDYCLDTFGPDRVLFGGDWPVCTLGASFSEWVSVLRTIIARRPAGEQARLLHDNAVRFYGL